MSKSIVRLAFDGSVACTSPPVRFHSSHESMVPMARFSSASTPPSVNNHSILLAREVRVEHQPGGGADQREVAGVGERVAAGRGAAVLPDDGAVAGESGAPVPGDDGLALVGDADGGDRLLERRDQLRGGAHDGVPDLHGVVLDPPGLREVLGELPVSVADGAARMVDGEGADTGGACVEGDHDCHGRRRYWRASVACGHAHRDPDRWWRLSGAQRRDPGGGTGGVHRPRRRGHRLPRRLAGRHGGQLGAADDRPMPRDPAPRRHHPRHLARPALRPRRWGRSGEGRHRPPSARRDRGHRRRRHDGRHQRPRPRRHPGRRRAQDHRQRHRRHRDDLRVPDRGADLHVRHRPAAHHRREPRPGAGRRGHGPPRRSHRRVVRHRGRRGGDPGARGALRPRRGGGADHLSSPARQLGHHRGRGRRGPPEAGNDRDGRAAGRCLRPPSPRRHGQRGGGRDRSAHRHRDPHHHPRSRPAGRYSGGVRPGAGHPVRHAAVDAVADGALGSMVALQAGAIVRVPVADGVGHLKMVEPDLLRTSALFQPPLRRATEGGATEG